MFDGAEGDDIGPGHIRVILGMGLNLFGVGFGAVGDYIDVRQCKGAGGFAEEGGFLVIRFDERQADGRSPDF